MIVPAVWLVLSVGTLPLVALLVSRLEWEGGGLALVLVVANVVEFVAVTRLFDATVATVSLPLTIWLCVRLWRELNQ